MESDVLAIVPKGRYEVTQVLGRGAFGAVYLGRDTETGRAVVLKLLHLPNRETLSRTDREIAILRQLTQVPHIVSFIDGYFSPDARSAVLVTEWVDGPSLQSLVEHQHSGLPNHVTVGITRQICHGLAYLHLGYLIIHVVYVCQRYKLFSFLIKH